MSGNELRDILLSPGSPYEIYEKVGNFYYNNHHRMIMPKSYNKVFRDFNTCDNQKYRFELIRWLCMNIHNISIID